MNRPGAFETPGRFPSHPTRQTNIMATMKRHNDDSWDSDQTYDSFDVTCVVGTVTIDPFGTMSPYAAAFALIADHGAPGTFTFPHDGDIVTVTIERS